MKSLFFLITTIVLTFVIGCSVTPAASPTSPPNLDATVAVRVAEASTQTAVALAQTSIAAQQTDAAKAMLDLQATQTSLFAASATPKATAALEPSATRTNTQSPPSAAAGLPTSTQPTSSAAADLPTSTNTALPVVAAETRTPPSPPPTCLVPFYVYEDWGSKKNHFVPEGFMGDASDIKLDDNFKLDAERPNAIKITYSPAGSNRWAGVYWWDPPGSSFGTKKDGGFDLSCANKLTFFARGENGEEVAEFKVGGLDELFKDSLRPAEPSGPIVLTNKWTQYTIDLAGKDLTHVIGGFVWVANADRNPNGATIYLDDIRFE